VSARPGLDLTWFSSQFPKLSALAAIGRGGQKQVLSAGHADLGNVVLKVFHLHGNLDRIVREIQATKQLSCAQVPEILEFGSLSSPIGEVVWLMERRVPGKMVRTHLGSGPLPDKAVLKVALDVLRPLAKAEVARMVHRDVKPENVMYDAASDAAYLLDFGLVRILDMDSLTASALGMGPATPGYAALEQLRNQKREIDARADLFGLGVTLYECCEGRNPLRDGATDLRQIIQRTEHSSLPRIARAVEPSGEFAELVYTMTRPRRDHRIGTVAEALDWMEDIARGAAGQS
jgi:serine/threonine-protein kinase